MATSYGIDLSFLRDRRARQRIAVIAIACATAGALYATFAPKWYRSVVTVVPSKPQKGGGLSSMLTGELGGLASGLADSAGIGGDVQRIAAVLQSNDVSDAVISKFQLKTRYGEEYLENTRDVLWHHCDVKPLPKPGLVQLGCEDRDPVFVQQLLQFFAEYGNQVFRRVSGSSASEQVRFLEKRVADLRVQADGTASRLRDFQEQHHIIDLDTQTKAVVGALASLNSQRISKQLELDYARTFSSGDESSARQLESQIAVVEQKLRTLEADRPVQVAQGAGANGMFPAALSVPKLRAEFETLYRDRKVSEVTLVFALERLESAKADEARDISTFLVLDPPVVPTRHVRPRRLTTTVALLLIGLVLGMAIEWWRNGGLAALAGRPNEEAPRAAGSSPEPGRAE